VARGLPDFQSPAGLDQPSWTRWLAYRQKIKKPIKPPSTEAAQKALAAFGADQAAVVEQSIAQGWQVSSHSNAATAQTRRTKLQRGPGVFRRRDEEIPHVSR